MGAVFGSQYSGGAVFGVQSGDASAASLVAARPVVQSSTVNAPSIVQTHVLTARPSVQGATVTRPGLTQTHMVTARAVTQGSTVTLGDLPVVEEVLGTGRLRVGPADMVLASQRIGTSSLPGTGPRIGTTILSTRRPGRMTI